MRIGLLTTSFPRFEGDTAGHFVHGFADALARRGHTLEVLAPEPPEGAAPCFDGMELSWVPYMRPRGLARTFYGAGVPDNLRRDPAAWLGIAPFTAALAAAALRRSHRWDAVVSHWALPCGVIGSRLAALPHLCVVHSADMWLLSRLPGRRALAHGIASAQTRMWFVAPHLRDQFEALLPAGRPAQRSVHVGPMGCAPPPPTRRDEAMAGRLRVLSMGRLVPIKGLDVLIESIAGLPGVSLTVAGEGPQRDALASLARRLGADVQFVGHVEGEHKARLLAGADVLCLPSRTLDSGRSEGAPTGVIEAMAAGLPVVASDTGGVSSLLRDGVHGRIIPPGDPTLLGQALARLRDAASERARMGAAAADHARQFAWPRLAAQAEDMLTG